MKQRKKKIVVAMSGGVDSSVAAALLKQRGFEVIGVFMRSWFDSSIAPGQDNRCCSLEASEVARRVADKIGIPFYVLNIHLPFRQYIVEYFLQRLAEGETPNPCIQCNRLIRFDFLLQHALALGADALATGHYVRLKNSGGEVQLHRGRDTHKDQSYVLYTLNQKKLKHLMYPIGDLTKVEVRKLAAQWDLAAADRLDSQDLCFIPKNMYATFLGKYLKLVPGPITRLDGTVVGQHQGFPLYTIGQREGLGVGGGTRLYVARKISKTNSIVVASQEELAGLHVTSFELREVSFIAGRPPELPWTCHVQVRYRGTEVKARLSKTRGRFRLDLQTPLRAITAGQSAVMYRGNRLYGGGIIDQLVA